jgi:hypothetical protein
MLGSGLQALSFAVRVTVMHDGLPARPAAVGVRPCGYRVFRPALSRRVGTRAEDLQVSRRSQSGVKGVYLQVKYGRTPATRRVAYRYWVARTDFVCGVSVLLYFGKDFFEAVCARKSWEAR